ncbi:DNA mismatch repair protein MSH5-like isoform X4 [Hibiscus syriacus]|uniref:DNA mismatch repair protein MSH5-like isoform X4 n=1 Tax=Hibiscus syriacus TaxID=106335 RepID=A0A6A2ZMG3_HIBSY|nr:DNA mismatch repair protein MSH5-like isoform X4 [Hibiscus syriacus]
MFFSFFQKTSHISVITICAQLDELRQIYEELQEFLEEALVSLLELEQVPHLCKEKFAPCIVYIHQISAYLMCFFEEKPDDIAQARIEDLEFVFSDADGETKRFFYRTPKTRELDNLLGDIYHKVLGRMHIITGPNYSGKSIYIKQVALIVFLSHIGSFVPGDVATVGLTDRIFCAMGGKLMTAEQSTFMIDLHQVGMI